MINIKTLKLILIIAFCSISSTIQAQTTKNIALSNKGPIVDELSFKEDAKDMGLTIKFLFDEDSNTLTVTLTSPKSLFVFWNDTRYKDVFSCHRWLLPEKLSYVVSSNTADSFRASKKFRKSLKRPRKKHLFKKWFEADGLQPVEKELKLVNDSIVQTFSIADRRSTNFTFRLREILTMDEVQSKGTSRQYEFTTATPALASTTRWLPQKGLLPPSRKISNLFSKNMPPDVSLTTKVLIPSRIPSPPYSPSSPNSNPQASAPISNKHVNNITCSWIFKQFFQMLGNSTK